MAVQDYYFALQNLSRSNKIFGFYSGSANFNYRFDYLTSSVAPGAGDIRLNSGSLLPGSTTNEVSATEIYLDEDDINNKESIISFLTQLDDLNSKGTLRLEVSGSSSYFIDYNIDSIHTGSSLTYMIVSASSGTGNVPSGDANNPISQSYAHSTSSFTTRKPLIATFNGSDLRGYHETDVTGSSTKYIVASSGSFGTPSTGSIPKPFNIDWGVPESTFIGANYYPSSAGYAWLWNDGFKVKHIKMNNVSSTGAILSDFIKHSEWARFVMYNPINSTGSFIHNGSGHYAEDYQLFNVTKYSTQNYSHLFVNQESKLTSFATDTNRPADVTDTFLATGDYVVYASSSGTVVQPTLATGIDKSIPQGYFPSSSTSYPTEQFFRGWAGANYYVNGTLISTGGTLDDPLQAFYSGSTERDKDGSATYQPSTPPFFINASASYVAIPSSSFISYSAQTNLTQIGPAFVTSGGDELIYYYKEDTNQIVIRGGSNLDTKKTANPNFDPLFNVELVNINATPTTYSTPEGFNIPVKESQSLWLYRGLATVGTGNGNFYKYNRFLHRPFKTYIVTSTGSIEAGYGEQNYSSGSYGSGSQPVGPPANEFETVYIAYSSSLASERPTDGIYTFDTTPLQELQITASVNFGYTSIDVIRSSSYGTGSYGDNEFEYGGTGSGDDVNTWQSATLKLYQNNNVIASDVTSINSTNILYGLESTLKTTLQPYEISIGDNLRLAVEVGNESSNFNSSLIVNNYTMSFGNLVYPAQDLVPVTFNNYLELNDDCDPINNNVFGQRPNERLQDVDYSVDVLNPINFDQIIKDEAVRATVPESHYTQLGSSFARYIGSSTSRRQINEYNPNDDVDSTNSFYYQADISTPEIVNKGKGSPLGKIPNVQLRNSYIAYFNKIIDTYPNLNGKTAYYVKYLIDESGTIYDPTLSDINFSLFEKTFQLYDYDAKPTRVKTSLQSIEEAKELSRLNKGLSSTFKLGKYPSPILYSQTSSLGHTNNIIMSGSPFYGTLGIGSGFTNLAVNINAAQSNSDFPVASTNNDTEDLTVGNQLTTASFASGDITPFTTNTTPNLPTGSAASTLLFPLDSAAITPNTLGADLSDKYEVDGEFIFYSSTFPARYRRPNGSSKHWQKGDLYTSRQSKDKYRQIANVTLAPFIKVPTNPSEVFVANSNNFEISQITLTPIENAGLSDESVYKTLTIEPSPSGFDRQYYISNNQIEFKPDSRYLEKIIIQQIYGNSDWSSDSTNRKEAQVLIGGGWYNDGQGNIGIDGANVVYKWSIKFKLKNVKQGSGMFLKVKGQITQPGDSGRNDDFFRSYIRDGDYIKNGPSWRTTFNPGLTSGYNTSPVLKYNITSPIANSDQNVNGAVGPYWRRISGTTDMLFMSSSILNQAYGIFDEDGNNTNGQYYVQAKIPYVGDTEVVFPSTIEPDFIEFDPVVDPWSLEIGDEIRFENNEDLVYTITSAGGKQGVRPPIDPYSTNPENDGLHITIAPPFEYTSSNGDIINKQPTNLDFFVVRRYKENRNFIILDQQKPYGFPVSASSSPGILLPEHRIEKYDRNPDEVLKDLIEKRII